MAINYEPFNQDFFKNGAYSVLWFNRKGVIQLDNERNAEITLVTLGTQGLYTGYEVQIIHKHNGIITDHYFGFSEFMKNRIDNRDDWENPFLIHENSIVHIYERSLKPKKTDWWYNAVPSAKDVDKMVESITTFISMYQ